MRPSRSEPIRQATFASLATFLAGTTSSFLYDPSPTEMNWRSLFGAAYAEDVIRVTRCLRCWGSAMSFQPAGTRAHDRAANYAFAGGVISSHPAYRQLDFHQSPTREFLPQPRVSDSVWSPLDRKTVLRAGFGMYNDLQDALGYRTDQNAPFNPTYSITALTVSQLPLNPAAPVPAAAKLVPGGVGIPT